MNTEILSQKEAALDKTIKFTKLGIPYRPNVNKDISCWSCSFLVTEYRKASSDFANAIQFLPFRANVLYKELKRRKLLNLSTYKLIQTPGQKGGMYFAEILNFKEIIIKSPLDIAIHKFKTTLLN